MSHLSEPRMGKEVSLQFGAIEAQISFLKGKVLTVIDASFSDERQLKAVKDLVKNAFSEQLTWIGQLCYPEVRMMTRNQVNEVIGDVDGIEASAQTLEI